MMIAFATVATLAALVAASAIYRVWAGKRKQERRQLRRTRNIAYQRAWDAIMRRPRTRRLSDLREPD